MTLTDSLARPLSSVAHTRVRARVLGRPPHAGALAHSDASPVTVRTLLGRRDDPALEFFARELLRALRARGGALAAAPLLLFAGLPGGTTAADVRALVPQVVEVVCDAR